MGANGDIPKQSVNDGMLEVVAIYSSFHIAQLQVGLSQPHRLGQAKVVEVNNFFQLTIKKIFLYNTDGCQ